MQLSSVQPRLQAKSNQPKPFVAASRKVVARAAVLGSGNEQLTYKKSGVDIDAGDELVKRIQKLNPTIGGFGGIVPFGDSYLVAGTDGVGTKLKLAIDLKKHDTVGIDLVAMSVNDIITLGAKPMFFLDYYATGKLDVDTAEQVIKGIVNGCNQSDCILLGGETAEMPGFYKHGEYDLAGFAVGSVKKEKLIDGKKDIKAGDVLLGLSSSGVHSNGFSLVRKILEVSGTSLESQAPWDSKTTFGEALLAPTVIYVRKALELHEKVGLKGVVHITGGGMTENIPRIIPKGLGVNIKVGSWPELELFKWLEKTGNVPVDDMRRTFNLGVGLVLVVDRAQVDAVKAIAPDAFVLGEIVAGDGVKYV
uniref:Phosphoribosylformylglycinamidine cyclo-ligase n=1 Tax=Polytomella parva TaxID=51329 RepID=A0A7S0VJZ2_9CHLO|nr:phosphoribosylformylglycinamidine cyclo-ligase (GART) [Polytomella parva]|mmetsp:Transcript_33758/g.60945  ORF Transcript_33758/g.60945 Transcript_33758/m.60945 type:complete len:363 (+) Transcript_33758:116-1204(+)|eukprot:CAMPEP_0175039444 /NCGR_PEP_ID=MMETSP0052_2-20121109/585_1 /TAXON_ID=51329 ORGANISM="Polytomella parva, Strain SAG 63-3" /NCGR_SAMPLE_ID=MMETSP0052_2 /ASSEMBLY_ACC=CAM_ASM_000194 /LENGTH=362 /DNA_ID=CAMNT_0016301293 /DNA_START=72 /DNA_END=1160 /DNA_ORIENTATION=+